MDSQFNAAQMSINHREFTFAPKLWPKDLNSHRVEETSIIKQQGARAIEGGTTQFYSKWH